MVEVVPDEGEAPVIVGLAEAAMHMYTSAIDALPHGDDPDFVHRADVILAGLRKLSAALTQAAGKSRTTPAVIVALSEVRGRYDELMTRVAGAPGAGLGQQLYVARRRAALSAQEVANGAGLQADLLDAFEAGEIPTGAESDKLRMLISALAAVPEPPQGPPLEMAHAGVNGFDGSLDLDTE